MPVYFPKSPNLGSLKSSEVWRRTGSAEGWHEKNGTTGEGSLEEVSIVACYTFSGGNAAVQGGGRGWVREARGE